MNTPERDATNDFLALEPHLVALAQQAVAGISPAVHVATSANLGGIKESMQRTPAVHLIHSGFKIAQTRGDGMVAQLRHTWLVVAVSKSSHGQQSARRDAGRLLARVAARLMGQRLPCSATALLPAESPPAWGNAGFQYVPMALSVETFFNAVT